MPVDLKYAIGLPPKDAIAYFESKGLHVSSTFNFEEVWQEAHVKSFFVTGVMKLDILQDIQSELKSAMQNGTDFERNITAIMQKKGWYGKGLVVDKSTGEIHGKKLSAHHIRTIFQTNMQMAFMVGRYKQMMSNVHNRPFWRYTAVMDRRTRPAHAALNGRVFRYDDPFWDSFFPPNGWRCRCNVTPMDGEDMQTHGYDLSSSDGLIDEIEVPISKSDPSRGMAKVARFKYGEGKYITPDAGFSYNVGKAALPNLQQVATQKLATAPLPMARSAVKAMVQSPAFEQFYSKPQGNFPVAVMSAEAMSRIGAKTGVVQLSEDTMLKQLREHPELTTDEYVYVQEAINLGKEIQDGESSLIFLLESEGYVTVVKATKTGKAVFVTSLRRLSSDEAKREREVRRLLDKEK